LLLVGLLALTSTVQAADDDCRDRRYAGDLAALFVAPQELGVGWDSLRETPSDPADDPDLRAAGVLAMRSLHYTREREGGSEVCSLEIWLFATAGAARRVRDGIERPGWRYALRGNLLMMSRGVSLDRARGFRPGLLQECHRLVDLTEALAQRTLGCSDSTAIPIPRAPLR
jgi:hypothetical protein